MVESVSESVSGVGTMLELSSVIQSGFQCIHEELIDPSVHRSVIESIYELYERTNERTENERKNERTNEKTNALFAV